MKRFRDWTRYERAVCYVAERDHPDAGRLIKIGSSRCPSARCTNLGANLLAEGLPRGWERTIHDRLGHARVWTRPAIPTNENPNQFLEGPMPFFSAPSEWLYPTDDVLDVVAQCIERSAR